MSFAVVAVVLLVMIPGTYFMIEHTVRDLFGETA